MDDAKDTTSDHAGDLALPLSATQEVRSVYVHPSARKLFDAAPFLRNVPVFGKATEGFGPQFVGSLAMIQLMCKGIGNYLIMFSVFPMFTYSFGLSGMEYQRMIAVGFLGYSVKPLVAILSDTFAPFGYTKRWYCVASCVVGAGMALGYGLLPSAPTSGGIAAALVFFTSLCTANVDILIEGHFSRLIHRRPDAGAALVSWAWWFSMIGSVVAGFIEGPLSDARLQHVGVFISAALRISTSIFFVFNWIEERPNRVERLEDHRAARGTLLKSLDDVSNPCATTTVPVEQGNMVNFTANRTPHEVQEQPEEELPVSTCCCGAVEVNKEVVRQNKRIFAYAILMTIGVVGLTVVTIVGDRLDLTIAAVTIAIFLGAFGFYALPMVSAKVNLYVFVHMASYLQLPGVQQSFYVATPECFPDGPHFSLFFYDSIGNLIGNVAGIVGTALFAHVFSKRSYRFTLILTMAVQILSSVFDIIIVKRWNVKVGINDHVMYIMGDQIVYEVCRMLSWMPCILLISRLCPRGVESIMYSLIGAFGNLGQALSSNLGSILMEYRYPIRTDPPCDFNNVPMLLLIGHFIIPMISLVVVFVLIPNVRVCDEIDLNGKLRRPPAGESVAETSTSDGPPRGE